MQRPGTLRILGKWLVLLFLYLAAASAQNDPPPALKEHQVKAAYLYNFAKFVEWPRSLFPDEKSPFVIGVFGDNPFGHDLETVIKGRSIHEHPIRVVYFKDTENLKSCHILFVSSTSDKTAAKLLSETAGTPVLTVGESERFKNAGGMITFVTKDEKVRFEIDNGAAEKAGLKISAQLLKLATSVSK